MSKNKKFILNVIFTKLQPQYLFIVLWNGENWWIGDIFEYMV